MRKIIFRGKRTDVDAWAYGYLNKHPSAIQVGKGSPYYIEIPPQDPDDDGGRYNVHPETVGQFTGLLDKHGNKIFEGDIVNLLFIDGEKIALEVAFYNGGFCVKILSTFVCLQENSFYKVEKIGNIYDNPELLATEDAGK